MPRKSIAEINCTVSFDQHGLQSLNDYNLFVFVVQLQFQKFELTSKHSLVKDLDSIKAIPYLFRGLCLLGGLRLYQREACHKWGDMAP